MFPVHARKIHLFIFSLLERKPSNSPAPERRGLLICMVSEGFIQDLRGLFPRLSDFNSPLQCAVTPPPTPQHPFFSAAHLLLPFFPPFVARLSSLFLKHCPTLSTPPVFIIIFVYLHVYPFTYILISILLCGFSTWWTEMYRLQARFLLAEFTREMRGGRAGWSVKRCHSLTDHRIDCKLNMKIDNSILLLCYLDKICLTPTGDFWQALTSLYSEARLKGSQSLRLALSRLHHIQQATSLCERRKSATATHVEQ